MTLDQIKKIVAQGESHIVEFKKSTSLLHAAFETVCAFLNSEGGTVLIGVTNGGRILGQEISDGTMQEIASKISAIEPSAQSLISISYVPTGDRNNKVIAIKVEAGPHIPYVYDGRPFHRVQSTSPLMPQHRYEQLIVQRGQLNHSWESIVEPGYSIKDLDKELIKTVINKAIQKERLSGEVSPKDIEDFLYRFRLMQDGKLTRAALLLFCKAERKQFIQSQVRLARFRGVGKDEFIDNKTYVDNIFNLYDKAMSFFENYLPIGGKIHEASPARIDTPSIPNKVLREALVNALCHRDYSILGGAVSIAIYDDRVEVSSTGTFPPGINIENLVGKHRSTPRNPVIASILYAVGYIEKWGRGIERIVTLSKEVGNPNPLFEETDIDVHVCLPLREPILSGAQKITSANLKADLTARQNEILTIINKHNLINIKQLLAELKPHVPQRTIQADLTVLKSMALIESKGKGRATVWIISKK